MRNRHARVQIRLGSRRYVSYAQSQDGILVDDMGDPASDGPVAKGWAYDIDAYNALAVPSSC